jgi:hypothetical protein
MKSKEEILDECGVRIFGAQQARILEAMECYAKQKLQQHSVMQAEGSDGAEGAAVGQRSVGQNRSVVPCSCVKYCTGDASGCCKWLPVE